MTGKLYFDPRLTSGFSTLKQLYAAARDKKIGKTAGELWAFTLHHPVRKRFPPNPYSVNNIMDVWECDLVDVQGLSKISTG